MPATSAGSTAEQQVRARAVQTTQLSQVTCETSSFERGCVFAALQDGSGSDEGIEEARQRLSR